MSKNDKTIQNAHARLLILLHAGWEFPEACYKAATEFGFTAQELREYDDVENDIAAFGRGL